MSGDGGFGVDAAPPWPPAWPCAGDVAAAAFCRRCRFAAGAFLAGAFVAGDFVAVVFVEAGVVGRLVHGGGRCFRGSCLGRGGLAERWIGCRASVRRFGAGAAFFAGAFFAGAFFGAARRFVADFFDGAGFGFFDAAIRASFPAC